MSATVCPLNPPGHDWEAGLSCRWCDATRTPSEAVLSGLASVRGWSREAARAVRDAHRTEVLNEAADMVHAMADPRCTCGGCDSCAARGYAKALREKATPTGATATPEGFFVAGRTYLDPKTGNRFVCRHLAADPLNGHREAWGWVHRPDGSRRRDFFWSDDYPQWTLAEAGEGRG